MFDILKCEADPSGYDFEKFYTYNSVKSSIAHADDLKSAVKFRNRKTLIMLKQYDFDIGSVKNIAEKKKACFLIDLSEVIRPTGMQRSMLISRLRTFLEQCNKHGAYYTFASFAEEKNQVRYPEELMHIAMLLGINKGQAKFALKMLPHYL
ncbi:TPA: hypothetical protein EYP38_01945 [Candidatus Micrarchaeota archaeon]|nr:hypothetical protein [Candidatus Micrarchaeota archaeon]